jgi:hypothetical protein
MVILKQPSPYSLMYLVTPAIYEKLLLCLDEGDKRLIDSLNKPSGDEPKRPSEHIANIIATSEVTPTSNLNTSFVGDNTTSQQLFTQPIHYADPKASTQVHVEKNIPIDVVQFQQPAAAAVVQQPAAAVVVQPQVAQQAPIIQHQILPQPLVDVQQHQQQVIAGPPLLINPAPLPQRIIERNKLLNQMDQNFPGPVDVVPRSSTPVDASMDSDFTYIDPQSQYPPFKKWDGKRKREDLPIPPPKRKDHEYHLVRDEKYHSDRFKRRQNRFMQDDPYLKFDPYDPVDWQPIDPSADVSFRTPVQCITSTTGGRICQPKASFKPIPARMKERYKKLKELDAKIKQRKSRFVAETSGNESEIEPYDPSKDVPFRKAKPTTKQAKTKPKSF